MKRLINLKPERGVGIVLGALSFVIVLAVYVAASVSRLTENADDKLLLKVQSTEKYIEAKAEWWNGIKEVLSSTDLSGQ